MAFDENLVNNLSKTELFSIRNEDKKKQNLQISLLKNLVSSNDEIVDNTDKIDADSSYEDRNEIKRIMEFTRRSNFNLIDTTKKSNDILKSMVENKKPALIDDKSIKKLGVSKQERLNVEILESNKKTNVILTDLTDTKETKKSLVQPPDFLRTDDVKPGVKTNVLLTELIDRVEEGKKVESKMGISPKIWAALGIGAVGAIGGLLIREFGPMIKSKLESTFMSIKDNIKDNFKNMFSDLKLNIKSLFTKEGRKKAIKGILEAPAKIGRHIIERMTGEKYEDTDFFGGPVGTAAKSVVNKAAQPSYLLSKYISERFFSGKKGKSEDLEAKQKMQDIDAKNLDLGGIVNISKQDLEKILSTKTYKIDETIKRKEKINAAIDDINSLMKQIDDIKLKNVNATIDVLKKVKTKQAPSFNLNSIGDFLKKGVSSTVDFLDELMETNMSDVSSGKEVKSVAVKDKSVNLDNIDLGPKSNSLNDMILNSYQSVMGKGYQPVITSGNRSDSSNRRVGGNAKSKHLSGKAIDLRTNDISKKQGEQVVNKLKNKLGDGYSILQHGENVDRHIHVQYNEAGDMNANRTLNARTEPVNFQTVNTRKNQEEKEKTKKFSSFLINEFSTIMAEKMAKSMGDIKKTQVNRIGTVDPF